MRKRVTTEFLNLDLDLGARSGIASLVAAFGPRTMVLHQDDQEAHLELWAKPKTVDEAIRRFAARVARFPPTTRRLWDRCSLRSLNVGIQGGQDPHCVEFKVSRSSITALRSMGAVLVFSLYGAGAVNSRPRKAKPA